MITGKRKIYFALFCATLVCCICMIPSKASASDTCEHEWSMWHIEKMATCTEPGIEYRECFLCGAKEYREGDFATGHDWDVWETIKKSTIYHNGKKERFCFNCHKVQYRIIPKIQLNKAEKKALNVATRYLRCARVYNVRKMKKCFTKPPKNYFFEKKRYLAKIARKYNKRSYKYKIVDVGSKKNNVRITVKITYPNGYKPFMKTLFQLFDYYIKHPDPSDSAVDNFMKSRFIKNTRKMGMKKSKKTLDFRIKKTKKGWKIKNASFDISDTTNCGYRKAYEDFSSD